ncbi:MAG TPA: hypothetical protein PK079_02850 [Leptospiraceae bacterium]|nr:hypothetical protein [Leptospiraceae bacterium]HMW04471.1 hypothetical protein [Leptospiraceae bacterium]HMX31129.1 hypothetical protein [Leptospiraceae bacterium]HMY30657.1 hypothetical protein [Leptospiraceae bacterium]HMZ65810.1 hypothetical protein [Leptospiraceae bacterium]
MTQFLIHSVKTIFKLVFIISYCGLQGLIADEPPSWSGFTRISANKLFTAKVSQKPKAKNYQSDWILTVSRKGKVLWSCPFEYRFGYPGGILTDDGNYFITVEVWYYKDLPLVDIYKDGRKINTNHLTGESFSSDSKFLHSTTSHFLWFNQSDYYRINLKENTITLITLDKKEHKIKLNTGEIQK